MNIWIYDMTSHTYICFAHYEHVYMQAHRQSAGLTLTPWLTFPVRTRVRALCLSDPRSLCVYSHNKKIYKQHTSNLWVSVCGCAYICMFVYIFVCVCMCICMYACMRVCVHVRAYVCVCIIICMCLEVCIIYLCRVKYAIQPCRQTRDRDGFGAVYTYINDVCVCVCVCVSVSVSVSVSVFLYIDR